MSEDQFTKLYKYMGERFDAIDEQFKIVATHDDVENLRDTVVDFAGHLDDYAAEMAAMANKIDRLEKYIEVIAKKTGIDLNTIHV